jgi:uncharacterized protein YoxC
MQRFIVYVAAIACAAAFLFMAKLMHDMNGHMAGMTDHVARMSADMGRMTSHMDTLVTEVSTIKDSVRFMAPMAADIQGLRESVGSMAGVIHKSGEQIERLNPMQMMEQMITPGGPGAAPGPQR